MRIVFLCVRYKSGTAQMNRLLAYGKAMGELGEDVHYYFLVTNSDRAKVQELYKGVTFHYVWEGYKHIDSKVRTLYYSLSKIKTFLQDGDRVLTYHAENILLYKLLQIKKRKKIKIYNEETENPDIYKTTPFYKHPFLLFQEGLIKKIDGLFVISRNLKSYYILHGVKNVNIINMIVDFSRFDGLTKDIKERYIAYCGTVSKQKDGVDLLIKSFTLFNKKHKDYKLYIIGPMYNSVLLQELQNLAKANNVLESIVFTGEIDAKEMPQLLKNARMLVLNRPNSLQAQAGFPTKLGEYLATANPVVVTNVGEIGDFLQDGVNAYVAKPNDIEDFADKMIAVADDYEKAEMIGEKGRITALEHFSSINEVKKILRVIK